MIRIIIFLLFAAVAVLGAVWFADRPGSVTLNWQGWQIETSVGMLVLAAALLAVISALLYRLWRALRRAPHALADAHRRGRRERGYKALTQGMVAVAAGDADEARRQARRADALLGEPPLTMLLSAQAAQLGGDDAAARRYFTAMLDRPETSFLGLRGLLMQAQRDGDNAAALQLAGRAYAERPKTPWVLATLFDLQRKAGHWRAALSTLDEALRRNAIARDDGRRQHVAVLLACSLEAEREGNHDGALSYARRANNDNAASLPAAIRLAGMLLAAGRRRRATGVVQDAWARTPHPELARLYLQAADADDPLERVKRIEKLVGANPDHPESHLALAEVLLAAKLWGAARTHLRRAAGAQPSARVCRLMATLAEGETGDAAEMRRWLVAAAGAPRDPAWTCSACGAQAADWTPVCAACNALGTIDWRVPPGAPATVLPPPDGPAAAAAETAIPAPPARPAGTAKPAAETPPSPPTDPASAGPLA